MKFSDYFNPYKVKKVSGGGGGILHKLASVSHLQAQFAD